jgi:Leucine-rich repeat (LRR) protein
MFQVIEERSFHGCRAVNSLSLSHSGLQHIQPGGLKPLASLTRLDLAYNSLSNLSDWHQVEGLARLQANIHTFQNNMLLN